MKILITGNMGYVGPPLVEHLRRTVPSAVLIGFDAAYFANDLVNQPYLPEIRIHQQVFGDVRQFPSDVLEGVRVVVHLAAISNDPMGNQFESVTREVNQEASIRLAVKAKTAGVERFVFASSCSVYGRSIGATPRKESDPLQPLTAYARSKLSMEEGLGDLADARFRVTILRFATACGAAPRLRLDLVLNDFVAAALSSGKIEILSDGTPWRPLIDVKDMARAIEWAISREGQQGGHCLSVNVGRTSANYQVKQLAEEVSRVIPGLKVSIDPNALADKRSYKVDFSLFEELAPSHVPRISLHQSINEIRDKLGRVPCSICDFRQSNLIRLNALNNLIKTGALNEDLGWN